MRIKVLFFICLALFAQSAVFAAVAPRDKNVAMPDLTTPERDNVAELMDNLGAAFVRGDVQACDELISEHAANRAVIIANLRREFHQGHYSQFTITNVMLDDTLSQNIYSIQVCLKYTFLPIVATEQPAPAPIENSINHSFLIEKYPNDHFKIAGSSFFDHLGRRRRISHTVNAVLAVMAGIALLAFCIWMGFDVWRLRPRRRVWRVIVLIPALGAVAYFLCAYLPWQFSSRKAKG